MDKARILAAYEILRRLLEEGRPSSNTTDYDGMSVTDVGSPEEISERRSSRETLAIMHAAREWLTCLRGRLGIGNLP